MKNIFIKIWHFFDFLRRLQDELGNYAERVTIWLCSSDVLCYKAHKVFEYTLPNDLTINGIITSKEFKKKLFNYYKVALGKCYDALMIHKREKT